MAEKTQTQQEITSQLDGLTETMQREKILLPTAISAYLKESVSTIHSKLLRGETIFPKDMEFIHEIEKWFGLSEKKRGAVKTVEQLKEIVGSSDATREEIREAVKKGISVNQWKALLHLMQAAGKDREWLDRRYKITDRGEIEVNDDLTIIGLTSLTKLPDKLHVKGYMILNGCTSLKELPKDLKVDGNLTIRDCPALTKLQKNLIIKEGLEMEDCELITELPDDLKIGKNVNLSGCRSLKALPENFKINGFLVLNNCTSLEKLPDNLHLKDSLHIWHCTGLKELPKNLTVEGLLHLSNDLQKKVKEDAERLRNNGKIGSIIYPVKQ